MLGVAFVAGLALEADLHTIWLGRNLVSAACGLFAGFSAYEPLQNMRISGRAARWLLNAATTIGVLAALLFPATSALVTYPMRSLYEACTFALVGAALLVVDRMRRSAVP